MFTVITIDQKCPLRRQIQSALGIRERLVPEPFPSQVPKSADAQVPYSPHSVSAGSASAQPRIHPELAESADAEPANTEGKYGNINT